MKDISINSMGTFIGKKSIQNGKVYKMEKNTYQLHNRSCLWSGKEESGEGHIEDIYYL